MKNFYLFSLAIIISLSSIAQIPTNGLVAWYPFNGNANDESGNGNNGSVFGANPTTDRFNNGNGAYSFNGIDNYIEVPNSPSLNIANQITISCWIKYNHTSACYEDIFMKGATSYGFQFSCDETHAPEFHLTSNVWRNLKSNIQPTANTWYHYAGTFDGNIQKVYVNGVFQNSVSWSGSINVNNDPLYVGYKVAGDNAFYQGIVDDIRIYNRTLNDAEIQALYSDNLVTCPSTVAYSGKTYNTVQIGTQCWFKENLNIGTRIDGAQEQTNDGIIEKYCYNDLEENCTIYGGLYQWDEMMQYVTPPGVKGICPNGWHIPTDGEWTTLTTYLGGEGVAGGKMKEIGFTHWQSPNNGATNSSGFTGLPGGWRYYDNGTFSGSGSAANIYSSSENLSSGAWSRALYYHLTNTDRNGAQKTYGFSCRCLKNVTSGTASVTTTAITNITQTTASTGGTVTSEGGSLVTVRGVCWSTSSNPTTANSYTTDGSGMGSFTSNIAGLTSNTLYYVRSYATNSAGTAYGNQLTFSSMWQPCPGTPTVSYGGQTYNTVQIGTQCWLKENLNIGTKITGAQDQTNNGTIEKYCYNDLESNCNIYGGLYQWDEMMQYLTTSGVQGICPSEWHIPTDTEWTTLTTFLGGTSIAGGKMKSTGTIEGGTGLWFTPNTGATNESGFTAVPAGSRSLDGTFGNFSRAGFLGSSSETTTYTAWFRSLINHFGNIYREYNHKRYGFSVRCLKDNTSTGINVNGNLLFGNVTINHPSQRDFTIGNESGTVVTVNSVTYPNGFSGNWNGGTIANGTNKIVTVTFAPTAVQAYSGVVTINFSAGLGTRTIPITGSGVQDNPGLTVSGNLDFGTVQQGSVDDRPIFLHNNTSSPITIDNIVPLPTGAFTAQMQNGNTILPNNSLGISILFYPPGLLTYNTTFTITADAPNGNVTFTATGKGGNTPVSWIGFYSKPENNSEVNRQVLDEHFLTEGATNPIKICADGSKATSVAFINNDPGVNTSGIIFNMLSDEQGNNSDYTGWFLSADYEYKDDGKTVTAKYTHPKYLNINGLFRTDKIQVVNSANGSVIYQQPVQIYRAPVVLVHGLWGGFTGMLKLYTGLLNSGKYNNSLLRITDYSATNAYSFFTNSMVIKNEINSSFQGLYLLKYSAGKVDIVAHSMGGILSRIYLQSNDCENGARSNCYRGDIHKLLTLNTPHSGTQIANFLLSYNIGAWVARRFLIWSDQRWDVGAVDDLRCNSTAIESLNGPSLNNHIVPCHAIQTEANVTAFDKYAANENSLTHIIADARFQSAQNLNNQVFADIPNDLIVPANSQRGGLNDYSLIEDVMHTASPNNSSVISKVKILLDENPANSVYFDQNVTGFDPPQITPTFYKTEGLETDPYPGQKNGLVTITSPTTGFSCSEGDTVQIVVSSSPNVNHLLVLINNKNTGTAMFDSVANSATFYYSVPNNIAGDIKIMAIGYDSTGFVDMDTLDIFTNPTATLDSLTFFTDNINIQLGQSVPITLFGYYNDLTLRNISQLNGTEYTFSDPTIASMSPGNVLNGLAIGKTILHAGNQNKNVYVYVTVDNLSQQLANITIADGNTNCYNANQIITVAGDSTTFIVQSGGSVTLIAGQKISYLQGTKVYSGGYMWGYIAPTGPWCLTPSMPAVFTKADEKPILTEQSSFKVYPNPTTGNFVLELKSESLPEKVTVDIFGILGEKALNKTMTGLRKYEFSISDRPVGIYFIRIICGDKAETVKIIKQ